MYWTQLCPFGVKGKNENEVNENDLRQDSIKLEIKSGKTSLDLYKIETSINENINSKLAGKEGFNIFFEYDCRVYLTQCLTFAHANNTRLTNELSKLFTDEMVGALEVTFAPVKTYDRCVMKATTEYNSRAFPSVANIVCLYLSFVF